VTINGEQVEIDAAVIEAQARAAAARAAAAE
jgi:hypothetical protein